MLPEDIPLTRPTTPERRAAAARQLGIPTNVLTQITVKDDEVVEVTLIPAHTDHGHVDRVLSEVRATRIDEGNRDEDHEDGLGFNYLTERAHIAQREELRARSAGTLTWRLVIRRIYRLALAAGHDPITLRAALVELAAVTVAWIEAIDRRTSGGA